MIDPNAVIPGRKNYIRGIKNRSVIIELLKKNYMLKTSEMAQKLNLSKACVRYHLNVLYRANITRKRKRKWILSKNIQRTISDYL